MSIDDTLADHERRLVDHESRIGVLEKSDAARDEVQGKILAELGTQTKMLEASGVERERRIGAQMEQDRLEAVEMKKRTAFVQRTAVVVGFFGAVGAVLAVFKTLMSLFGH